MDESRDYFSAEMDTSSGQSAGLNCEMMGLSSTIDDTLYFNETKMTFKWTLYVALTALIIASITQRTNA